MVHITFSRLAHLYPPATFPHAIIIWYVFHVSKRPFYIRSLLQHGNRLVSSRQQYSVIAYFWNFYAITICFICCRNYSLKLSPNPIATSFQFNIVSCCRKRSYMGITVEREISRRLDDRAFPSRTRSWSSDTATLPPPTRWLAVYYRRIQGDKPFITANKCDNSFELNVIKRLLPQTYNTTLWGANGSALLRLDGVEITANVHRTWCVFPDVRCDSTATNWGMNLGDYCNNSQPALVQFPRKALHVPFYKLLSHLNLLPST